MSLVNFPESPEVGEVYTFGDNAWRWNGVAWDNISNSNVTYVHNQGTPSDTWTITHNLGYYPNISVIDSTGTVVEGDTVWPDSYTIVVSFESAFSGKAYLS